MDLKQIFIANLRKFRNKKGISQMKLAERCNTATNYIGEIEIGRRFPSLPLIEKIGRALEVEPYRFFMEEPDAASPALEEAIALLSALSDKTRLGIINRISGPPG
ncbi:MAG: helix-turn-helix transcriptional regulator [Treponema sp.]|jgi:transcriptional regulator with XRE-family HTH domain|nr:helix-turn-helix transcriptional regulator [Treponema sp.]